MNVLIILSLVLLLILFPFLIGGISGAIFFPTKKKLIGKAIRLAKINKSDEVVDLGSGDGRFLFEACQFCKYVIGYEIHPGLVLYSKVKILLNGYKNVSVFFKDFWSVDLSKYDVIFVFLYPSKMKRLEDKIINEVTSGTRVISYAFELPNLKHKSKTKDGLYLYEV